MNIRSDIDPAIPVQGDVHILDNLRTLTTEAGLECLWRMTSRAEWDGVSARVAHVPIACLDAEIDYKIEYFASAGHAIHDISMVLLHDRRPCGIWSLTLRPGTPQPFGTGGGDICPPVFVPELPEKSRKQCIKACLDFLRLGLQAHGGTQWQSAESQLGLVGLSEWHQQAMAQGAHATLGHDLYVRTDLPMDEIRRAFRKSYKPLISSGLKLWDVSIMTEADEGIWNEFRQLHIDVAGRKTRSDTSWDKQLDGIRKREGFFVGLRNAEHRLVGGGLFFCSPHEAVYAVAAYDRDLFDKPLGHVVQHAAIEEIRRRGIPWYCIGTRHYPGDRQTPSDKELRIAEFKQGFASHQIARIILTWQPD